MGKTKATIMVVDDHEKSLLTLNTVLEIWGYRSLSFRYAREAEEFIREGEKYDILMCDRELIDGDGTEIMGLSKEVNPYSKIICMSGYNDPNFLLPDLRIHKPFDIETLERQLERILVSPYKSAESIETRKPFIPTVARANPGDIGKWLYVPGD